MAERGLVKFFEKFLNTESLFSDKKVLQSSYTPENIPHRDAQIQQIATILAPALKMERPSNIFIYGKTGTGKTLSVQHTTNQILEVAKLRDIPVKIIPVNCKLKRVADTEYRLMAELARSFDKEIPATGLPTDEVYKIFFKALDNERRIVLLVLDEIDQLIKKAGDEILYNLTRINESLKQSQICIIGISNNLMFTENIDPRVKSSLSEEEILFPPYNALQIQDILKQRAKLAFKNEVLEQGVLEKCAAYAAREHGDARRALDLLRVAGELAERKGMIKVMITDIDEAEEKIERDRIVDIVQSQPKQFQAALYAMLCLSQNTKSSRIATGDIYDLYTNVCAKAGLRPLTQRRISDIIAELDMLGIINAKVISKGRYGRTREIGIAISPSTEPAIKSILKKELNA
ncbi:MAG: ORC1-type DNA replication protein [Nanoarchaeota archaeon]|nr:ORC1-type DNA replication protein [Nanoarchaeota archaeon]